MATPSLLTTVNTSTDLTTVTTSSFTPTAGRLLVAACGAIGTAIVGTFSTSDGITFVEADTILSGGTRRIVIFVAEQVSDAVPQTATWNLTGDGGTAEHIHLYEVDGLSRVGADAIRQSNAATHGANATPQVVLPAVALTGNCLLGAEIAAVNASITEPSSWTEGADTGTGTPVSRMETAYITSGFTSDTIAWGSAPTAAGAAVVVEFDASAAGTEFAQELSASLTAAGVRARQAGKSAAAALDVAGAHAKQVGLLILAALAGAAAAAKSVGMAVAAALTIFTGVQKSTTRHVTAQALAAAALLSAYAVQVVLTAGVAISTAVGKAAGKALSAVAQSSTAMWRGATRTLAGTLVAGVHLALICGKIAGASIAAGGAAAKTIGKRAATIAWTASAVSKAVGRTVTATLSVLSVGAAELVTGPVAVLVELSATVGAAPRVRKAIAALRRTGIAVAAVLSALARPTLRIAKTTAARLGFSGQSRAARDGGVRQASAGSMHQAKTGGKRDGEI